MLRCGSHLAGLAPRAVEQSRVAVAWEALVGLGRAIIDGGYSASLATVPGPDFGRRDIVVPLLARAVSVLQIQPAEAEYGRDDELLRLLRAVLDDKRAADTLRTVAGEVLPGLPDSPPQFRRRADRGGRPRKSLTAGERLALSLKSKNPQWGPKDILEAVKKVHGFVTIKDVKKVLDLHRSRNRRQPRTDAA